MTSRFKVATRISSDADWLCLPPQVLEKVLSSDVDTYFRGRTVCKVWNLASVDSKPPEADFRSSNFRACPFTSTVEVPIWAVQVYLERHAPTNLAGVRICLNRCRRSQAVQQLCQALQPFAFLTSLYLDAGAIKFHDWSPLGDLPASLQHLQILDIELSSDPRAGLNNLEVFNKFSAMQTLQLWIRKIEQEYVVYYEDPPGHIPADEQYCINGDLILPHLSCLELCIVGFNMHPVKCS